MSLDKLTALTQALPVLVLLFTSNKLDRNFKLFGWFCLVAFITEIICYYMVNQHSEVNPIQNIYTLVEMICLFYLLHTTITQSFINKFLILAYVICMCCWIWNLVATGNITNSFQYADAIYSFFVSIFAAISLINIASRSNFPLLKNSYYLRSLGLMFYFSSCVVLYSLHYVNFNSVSIIHRVWDIHAVVNAAANMIYSISIWQNSRACQNLYVS